MGNLHEKRCKKFKIGGDLDFYIKNKNVVKNLNIKLSTLRKRLLNFYTKKTHKYIEIVYYVRIKNKDNKIIYI